MSSRAPAPTAPEQTALDELHAAEQLIDEVEQDRNELRRDARAAIGVDGEALASPDAPRGGYLVTSTTGLALVAGMPLAVIALLGLPLAAGMGRSGELVTSMMAMFGFGAGLGALTAPAIAKSIGQAGDEYAKMAFGGTAAIAVGMAIAGFLTPVGGMTIAGLGAGLSAVGRGAVLARGTAPVARVRGMTQDRAASSGGVVIASLMIAALAYGTEAPISSMVLGLGVLVLLALAGASDLVTTQVKDGDLSRLRKVVDEEAPGDDLPTAEPFRRVWAVETVRRLSMGYAATGMALVGLHVYLVRFLTQEVGLGLWGRGAVYAAVCLATVAAIRLSSKSDAARFRQEPSRLGAAAASSMAAAGVALGLASVWPWYSQVLLLVAGFALVGVAHAQMDLLVLASVRPRLRVHALAVTTAITMLAGVMFAVPMFAAVARRFQTAGVLFTVALVLLIAAAATRRTGEVASADVDAAVDDEIEAAQVAVLVASGAHLPLLACRHIDFSYGTVQVLFDVSFSVDRGEMVGLLGTNGAGKSTLLRVISGLGTPTSGTVRQQGEDITYLDPAVRVGRGITQIPGGKAVFGPLSVADNLRVYGHSLGRDRKAVDRGIEASFEAFPRLHERRNLPSRVLSGGERQMLALSKALILEPKLLLIDELSLGLAPVIVGQLLDMVRKINERGTAVVLVEQSVNVALALVDHAYYMEKGEIRFDGAAKELLERPDLLRSVYLQGAAEGLA